MRKKRRAERAEKKAKYSPRVPISIRKWHLASPVAIHKIYPPPKCPFQETKTVGVCLRHSPAVSICLSKPAPCPSVKDGSLAECQPRCIKVPSCRIRRLAVVQDNWRHNSARACMRARALVLWMGRGCVHTTIGRIIVVRCLSYHNGSTK